MKCTHTHPTTNTSQSPSNLSCHEYSNFTSLPPVSISSSEFEAAPHMALNSTQQGCDSSTAVDLADNVPLSNSVEVYVPLETQLSMDDQMNSQMYMLKTVESEAKCCEKYVDIEKGKSGTPNEETVANLKNEEGQMKQISCEMGGKYMQFLMNHSLISPKFSTRGEKVVEGPRMRKYKRTASFNSRKVALMFSVLSSLGTIILIYLTLRVKQMADASFHSE